MQFTDEWLVPTVETLVAGEAIAAIRATEGPPSSLWETLVQRKLATDAQILAAVSARFRFGVAELARVDPAVKDSVPEQLVRKYNVVPLRVTESLLEIGTANPFDLDAEKALAFATGRDVRLLLASPARIREK